jgi:polysaccharide export outer membrane protein
MKVTQLASNRGLKIGLVVMAMLWSFTLVHAESQVSNPPAATGQSSVHVKPKTNSTTPHEPMVEAKGRVAHQSQGTAAKVTEGYHLGAGDVLTIRVYGEDDMSREKFRLPDSGNISFPFGDVVALGLTVSQLETRITEGLRGRFLINPRVSVSIEEYRQFFIYGQVERPGGYPFQPGLNVRKAVSIAGGFKVRASTDKIFIVREGDAENAAAQVTLNSLVWPGDTITVEESFF